jgi:hypothetical protein
MSHSSPGTAAALIFQHAASGENGELVSILKTSSSPAPSLINQFHRPAEELSLSLRTYSLPDWTCSMLNVKRTSPICIAAFSGHLDIVETLIAAGAKLSGKVTPLMMACASRQPLQKLSIVKTLLDRMQRTDESTEATSLSVRTGHDSDRSLKHLICEMLP